jgi:hypothetical protein
MLMYTLPNTSGEVIMDIKAPRRLRLVGVRAQSVEVSAAARRHLPSADYLDAYRVTAPIHVRAEEWTRRALEGGPEITRRLFALLAWRGVLGMRLAPAGTPNINGARIVANEPGVMVLAVEGRLLEARLVFEADDAQASFSTLVRYRNPTGRRVWAVARHAHRVIARGCIEQAARSLAP